MSTDDDSHALCVSPVNVGIWMDHIVLRIEGLKIGMIMRSVDEMSCGETFLTGNYARSLSEFSH